MTNTNRCELSRLGVLEGILNKTVKVEQFHHSNQFVVRVNNMNIFQSYETIIATWDAYNKVLSLNGEWWDYSNTTRRHFYMWLEEVVGMSTDDHKKEWFEKVRDNDYTWGIWGINLIEVINK